MTTTQLKEKRASLLAQVDRLQVKIELIDELLAESGSGEQGDKFTELNKPRANGPVTLRAAILETMKAVGGQLRKSEIAGGVRKLHPSLQFNNRSITIPLLSLCKEGKAVKVSTGHGKVQSVFELAKG